MVRELQRRQRHMSISPIFMFAPVPLTSERSPLAHAAALARRRMAEVQALAAAAPIPRKKGGTVLKVVEKPSIETAAA
jgi:hypothetical protein